MKKRNLTLHKKHKKNKTKKNRRHLGGASLAYTGKNIQYQPNPFLAYTGKGGSSCSLTNTTSVPSNLNAQNPAYPNTGPVHKGSIIFNNASSQSGGDCGCKTGGGCSLCSMGFMVGGVKHRKHCKCSKCKSRRMRGGNNGIPYPNGLVGSSWTSNTGSWPGVNNIPGDSNHYPMNNYHVDPQTSMLNIGANPPFIGGKKKKQKGGTLSNFLGQDLINLGRQFQFGVGSAYNALAGYASPVNPMPWKDQFPNHSSLNQYAI